MEYVTITEGASTSIVAAPPKKKFKCPYCDQKFERQKLHIHIQNEHEDMIPEGYTALRVAFNSINHKTEGHCIICKSVTDWNENKARYERLCNNPACHEAYKKMAAERTRNIYGVDRLQTDPKYAEFIQRKALENRRMAGKYKFADGGEIQYLGTYEKKLLEFMDRVMGCKSEDILAPGPSIVYMFDGQKHLYIPDFYYEPYNLIIEIKDGGNNPNTHPKRIEEERKNKAKEDTVRATRDFNYVRVTNNEFGQLLSIMAVIKFQLVYHKYYYQDPVIRVNESVTEKDKKIYHLSFSNINGKTINPSVPDNYLVKNGYEDSTTKRVCFCESIDKCLAALSQNLTGKEFFVNIPDGDYNVYIPSVKEVPDSKVTGELWIKEPVKMKCIGKIKVTADDGKDGMKYTYGNNEAELYGWNWEWIDKISESTIYESTLINEKDIYYNKDKFDSGEINLCFITGHSGSGKSTMAHNAECNNVEAYELDDLYAIKDHFTMDQLKEYGDLIYSYFKGPGKQFYLSNEELNEQKIPESEYEDKMIPGFVHYAMNYAKSHKNKKFIVEGIYLFNDKWFTPSEFKDYAFYIKGTSTIISKLRAAKRDSQDAEKNKGLTAAKHFIFNKKWKVYNINEKKINRFRDYFKGLMKTTEKVNESVINNIDTIVTDFGGVLIKTSDTVENEAWRFADDHNMSRDTMRSIIMKYYEAIQYDETCTVNQAKTRYKKLVGPDYAKYTDDIFDLMSKGKVLCDYTIKLLTSLKNKGYKLYYLSNVNEFAYKDRKANKLMDFVPKYFNGGLYSFETGYQKPDLNIYKLLIDKYNIDPSRSIFIDDKEKNVEAARSLGFTGIVFDRVNASNLKDLMNLKRVNESMKISEDMSGTIAAALPPTPIPHECNKDNYYIVQHPQNNVFAYGITKDPMQSTIYGVDPQEPGFYKAYKTDKSKINKKYLTFKIKDSQSAKELYDEFAMLVNSKNPTFHDNRFSDDSYIYSRLTEGSEIITPDQLLFDSRFELVKDPSREIKDICQEVYNYLKGSNKPIDLLEEQVNLLEAMTEYESYNVMPEGITSIEQLTSWKASYDRMPYESRVISDDLSTGLYGSNNLERYNKKYAELMENIDPDKSTNNIEAVMRSINSISESAISSIIPQEFFDNWDIKAQKVKEAENQGLIIMILPNARGVDYTDYAIAELKKKWDKLQSLEEDKRVLSGQTASDIFGMDNDVLYTKILAIYSERLENEMKGDVRGKTGYTDNSDPSRNVALSSPVPYFTPGEYGDYISSKTNIVRSSESGEIDSVKYSQVLKELYLKLRNTSDKSDRELIKEEIYSFGWNPEVPYTEESAKLANLRYESFSSFQELNAEEIIKEALQQATEDIPKELTSEYLKDKIVPVFVVLCHGKALHSKGIMWFTDSEWSHASLSFDSSLDEMYSFTTNIDNAPNKSHRNGFAIETKDRYKHQDPHMKIKVYALFITPEQKAQMQEAVQWYIKHQDETKYGFKNLLNIFFRKVTKRNSGDKCKMVCSQFVYTILNIVNFRLRNSKDSSLVSPADIDSLSNDSRFYVVYQGEIDRYNKFKVDDLCYRLLPTLPMELYGINESTGKNIIKPISALKENSDISIDRVFKMAEEIFSIRK